MVGRRNGRKRLWLAAVLLIAAAALVYNFWSGSQENQNSTAPQSSTANEPSVPQQAYPVIDLQPTVDAWAAKQSGQASVVIYDLANKQTVAALNPDRQYFAASIYKLYVAYAAYLKIADGTYDADETYLGEYTRSKCLDLMIRESYSPCGEKWWNELGKVAVTAQMKTYGLKNTSLTGLYTSAADAAIILQRLFEARDLTSAARSAYLDSMKDQPALYRRGLPSGFNAFTVYDKVGWNGLVEWHDTAIVTLPNKRSYVITVLTQNVGSAQIAALGKAIETRLTH